MESKNVTQVFCTFKLGTETGTCWLVSPELTREVRVTKLSFPGIKTWKNDDPGKNTTTVMTDFKKFKCSMEADTRTWEETKLSCKDVSGTGRT